MLYVKSCLAPSSSRMLLKSCNEKLDLTQVIESQNQRIAELMSMISKLNAEKDRLLAG